MNCKAVEERLFQDVTGTETLVLDLSQNGACQPKTPLETVCL